MNDTPRVWVGTLGLYNAGFLIGEWFDAIEAPQTVEEFLANESIAAQIGPRGAEFMAEVGEELWCFDHENFAGLLKGECSPMEAKELAEFMEGLDDVAAYAAYADYVGREYATPEGFEEAYCGEWNSEEEYAQDLAESCGMVNEDATWPNSYIDWGRATRDLFMDYYSAKAPGGCVYVFRCN